MAARVAEFCWRRETAAPPPEDVRMWRCIGDITGDEGAAGGAAAAADEESELLFWRE